MMSSELRPLHCGHHPFAPEFSAKSPTPWFCNGLPPGSQGRGALPANDVYPN